MSKIISVWGCSSSGKTTLSAQLAYKIAKEEALNVILVSPDIVSPTIPVLFPLLKKKEFADKSLGKILQSPEISQDIILQNLVVPEQKLPLTVCGYTLGENSNTYAQISLDKANDFVMQLAQMCDIVICDLTSEVANNLITTACLLQSDEVIKLYTAEPKSEVFFTSVKGLLQNERFGYDSYIKVLRENIRSKKQAENEISNVAGGFRYTIPYSVNTAIALDSGQMFDDISDKKFNKVCDKMIKEVILNDGQ